MALRELDIDIELDVDASGLATVNAQINQMVSNIERIPDIIRIGIDMDGINGALAQTQALQMQVDALDNTNVDIDVGLDNAALQAQLATIQAQINNANNDDITIDVHAEYAETLTQLQHLEQQVNSLDANDVFIDVDIDAHTNDILALRAHLRMLELEARNINVDLDTAGAHAQLALLQAHINGIRGPSLDISGGFNIGNILSPNLFGMGVKLTAILIALPAIASLAQVAVGALGSLGYALGVVATGALSLGSAVAVAGIGVVGFGALAISSITQLYEENAKLSAAQIELKKHTDSVVSSWKDMQQALQPITFSAIESGVKVVNSLLDHGQPVMKNATKAIDGLFQSLNQSLKGVEMQDFFSYLERAVGPLTTNLGKGLGNALKGVANTMVALEPLTSWVGQGFENAMGRFAKWTAGAKDSDGFKSFMESTKTNLSSLGGILKEAGKGVGKFFGAFDVTATEGLDWLEEKMKEFSKWAGELGENDGFQKMLKDIAKDGPEIAKTIGNVTKNIMELTKTLSSIGKDENGEGGIWSWLSDMTSGKNIPKLDFAEIFKGGALGMGLEALGIEIDWSKILGLDSLGEAVSGIGPKVVEAFGSIGNDIYQAIQSSSMPSFLKDGLSKMFEGFEIKVPDQVFDNLAQGAMEQVNNAFNGGVSKPFEAELSLFQGKEIEVDVGANTTPAQTAMKSMTAEEIQAKVDADTAAAQSKLDALDATPIKIETDTSAIAANIENMVATVQLNADTSTITNSIQNMPGAKVKISADTASLTNSIGNLPDARISLKADTIKITNNIAPVNVPANLSSINTSGLGPVKLPVTPTFAGGGTGINFNWPPMPKFTFPSLPKFSWPAMPKFSWPALPKWTWPPMPKFSWPPMPKFSWPPFPRFSWPPMPTVKVNVSGAGANGSHASGLGRVPFDGYMGELHKNESVLTASQSQGLRDAGVLRGDGTSPTVDLSAVASSAPVATASATQSGNGQATYHINLGGIHVSANGGDPDQIASKIREGINEFFESVQDVMPPVMEI